MQKPMIDKTKTDEWWIIDEHNTDDQGINIPTAAKMKPSMINRNFQTLESQESPDFEIILINSHNSTQ